MRRRLFLGSLGALAVAAGQNPASAQDSAVIELDEGGPVLRTRSGALRGSLENGVHVFRGIPFAAPPFGPNHLQPPRPPEPWDGVRDALAFGPKPPQVEYPPGIERYMAELVGPGEDCLTLNVWSPELGAAGLPVMVWIPGGMFEFHATGAAAYYDGSRLARDGVVLVTLNHRVGAEGFLFLDDGLANLGLLDQIAALEWVRDNIAAFGGDPGRVTIFGQSAGAMSVGTLCAMPRARGLFHRGVIQSGNAPHVNSAATAQRIGHMLAERLGVEPTREAIAAQPVERILAAQQALREEMQARPDPTVWGEVALTYLPWAPVVDGNILPQVPAEAVRAGAAADIPLLIGSTTEETRLFFVVGGTIDQLTDEAVAGLAASYGLSAKGLAGYRAAHPEASPGDLYSIIQTDWYWRLPAMRLADAHAGAGGATWMYEFAWRSPAMDGRLGAAHGLEMPFVFDTLGLGTEPMAGSNPPHALADAMHRAWVAFASTQDPGWPRYDTVRRATMHFDTASKVVDDPLARQRALWEAVR